MGLEAIMADLSEDEDVFIPIRAHLTPAIRARAEAEWNELPDGRPWTLADHIAGRKVS